MSQLQMNIERKKKKKTKQDRKDSYLINPRQYISVLIHTVAVFPAY